MKKVELKFHHCLPKKTRIECGVQRCYNVEGYILDTHKKIKIKYLQINQLYKCDIK